MERWLQVSHRFADDELARANLADNATSLASAENDPVALAIAIDSYELLKANAEHSDQKAAIDKALETLRNWRI
jgi:ribosome-associated translation inhibitor RaiA